MAKLAEVKQVAEELKMREEEKAKEEQKMSEMSQASKSKRSNLNSSFKRKKLKSGAGKRKKSGKGTRIIMSQSKKSLKKAEFQTGEVINMKTASNFFKPGGRAYSANVYGNPKLRRYEQVIMKLKKMISAENKKLRDIKTVYSKEIESKTQLEQLLRQ